MAKTVIADLIQIFKNSVFAVLPENLIKKSLKYNSGTQLLTINGEDYNLQNKDVYLVGTGKAVQSMGKEVVNILRPKIKQGIISIPEGSLGTNNYTNIVYHEGAKNNLPDTKAEETAKSIRDLAISLNKNDLLLVLISGGGSVLLPLPKEPIKLEEKKALIKQLANAGADITELNTVRKRISDIKGGQLAITAQPAKVISLVLSDIVGDPLDLIASGPTSENEDNPLKAIDVLKKYNLYDNLPQSIHTVLNCTTNVNTFPRDNVKNHIIGSNTIAIATAISEAKDLNYLPIALSNIVTGNVKDVAQEYSKLVQLICRFLNGKADIDSLKSQMRSLHIPGLKVNQIENLPSDQDICLILGGEITVEVKGSGKGGRNQQLALEFSNIIHNTVIENYDVYLLSAGTDGIDGPTNAAGAIGYKHLVSDCKRDNLEVNKYLENNDSYNFYKAFNNGSLHVITGHTNTNVMDIHLIIITRSK